MWDRKVMLQSRKSLTLCCAGMKVIIRRYMHTPCSRWFSVLVGSRNAFLPVAPPQVADVPLLPPLSLLPLSIYVHDHLNWRRNGYTVNTVPSIIARTLPAAIKWRPDSFCCAVVATTALHIIASKRPFDWTNTKSKLIHFVTIWGTIRVTICSNIILAISKHTTIFER